MYLFLIFKASNRNIKHKSICSIGGASMGVFRYVLRSAIHLITLRDATSCSQVDQLANAIPIRTDKKNS